MNQSLKRAIGLTFLIILISVAVWVIVYFGNQSLQPKEQAPAVLSTEQQEAMETPFAGEINTLWLGTKPGDFLGNPFTLPVTSTFMEDRYWSVVDAKNNVVASGTFYGAVSSRMAERVLWYSAVPASETGELIVAESAHGPKIIVPVKLQTKTQTVEIYFRNPAMSNCSTVDPVKRTIVSTDGSELNFYEAAIRELLRGPDQEESMPGLVTMIPEHTQILRIGKNEQGRYIADFSSELKYPAQIECFWNIAKNQIKKTLATVPLPGITLEGVIYVNGEPVE